MQKLMGKVRRAAEQYAMISDGDNIAVGLSGGKDSVALLYTLAAMRSFYPAEYNVTAVSIDMRFGGADGDFSPFDRLCRSLGVDYIIERTDIARIVFEENPDVKPCSLCARLRRGALINAASDAGCNKLALGHHEDDAVQTFMMNLLVGGSIGCFSPVTEFEDRNVTLIRPLILASESMISGAVRRAGLPVMKSLCPVDSSTQRSRTKELIDSLNRDYPRLREKIITAMRKRNIDGW